MLSTSQINISFNSPTFQGIAPEGQNGFIEKTRLSHYSTHNDRGGFDLHIAASGWAEKKLIYRTSPAYSPSWAVEIRGGSSFIRFKAG